MVNSSEGTLKSKQYKQVLVAAGMALFAACIIAVLVLKPGACAAGTVRYQSGPVTTCVPESQSAFLACLGQIKSTYAKEGSDPARGQLEIGFGDLTLKMDTQGGEIVVPESSTVTEPSALAQVKQCGKASGLDVTEQNVIVDVRNSPGTNVSVVNRRDERAAAPKDEERQQPQADH